MQIQGLAILMSLGPIQLASDEGPAVRRVIHRRGATRRGDARELRQELAATLSYELRQIRVVISEIEKRARRRELLPLKEHRRLRQQQQQRGERTIAARARLLMKPAARTAVGHLIVILGED